MGCYKSRHVEELCEACGELGSIVYVRIAEA